MAAITAELSLEITRLKAGLDAARTEIRNFKRDAQREGAGMSQAVFGGGGTSARGLGDTGRQVQNASYQVQDFIVQVQGGQSAMRAFAQQAPQLLGAFGAWGAVIGIVAALLPVIVRLITDTKDEGAEAAKVLKDMADAMNAVNQQLTALAKADAAKSLANQKDQIAKIGSEWENAAKMNAAYMEQIQKTADAVRDLDLAHSKLREQNDISKAASPEEADAATRRASDRSHDIGLAHDEDQIRRQRGVSQMALNSAGSGVDTINATLTTLRGKIASAEAEMRKGPKEAESDQSKVLNQFASAVKDRSITDPAQFRALLDSSRAAREQLNAGKVTYNNPSQIEKGYVDEWKASQEINQKKIDGYRKEIEELEKRRGAALKTVDAEKENLRILGLKQQTIEATAQAEKEKTANEEREKTLHELGPLREETEKNERKLMSPKEHAAALRADLAKAFGIDSIKSGDDVKSGLAKLKKDAEDAKSRGDTQGEKEARKKLKSAQDESLELSGLGTQGKKARVAGETASAIGILLGSGGHDLVLDESKRGNQLLEKINTALQSIDRKTGGNVGGDGLDIFDL